MNSEQLSRGKELTESINKTTNHLQQAKTGITITYYKGDYHSVLPIPRDLINVIQVLVVDHLAKKLVDLQKQFDVL